MNWAVYLFLFCVGMLAGLFYFGGLWLTVKKITDGKSSYFWFFASFLFRSVIVVLVFYLFMDGEWSRALAQICGFICVRVFLTNKMKLLTTEVEAAKR